MKLLFENFRKFVDEGGFSGNGPLAEPIEEIGGLRFDDRAPFGRERDPTGPSAIAARGLEAPVPADIADEMENVHKENPKMNIDSEEFLDAVDEKFPKFDLFANSNYDLVSAAIELFKKERMNK